MPPKRTQYRRAKGNDDRHGAAWRLLAPFAVFVLAALAAAGHRLLGEPLGPAATVKLADLWQTMAAVSLAYAPIYGQYRRQSAVAEAASTGPRRRLSTGSSAALQRSVDNPTDADEEDNA